MGEKDNEFLDLSLSLGGNNSNNGNGDCQKRNEKFGNLKLNMMMSLSTQHMQDSNHHPQSPSWTHLFPQSAGKSCGTRLPFPIRMDMNQTPPSLAGDCDIDESNGVSSPNSTISSISAGKKINERDPAGDETEAERASSSRGSDDEDGGDASRKKLRLSKEQSLVLEETFKEQNTLNPKQKLALAKQLNLRPRQVEVWFQNRRARTKLKQTEVDCEYLKRCCENLTEENRRLQKEVQELRALKLSPQLYMHMNPPTTLTMCPSCERVAVSSSSSSSASVKAPGRHPEAPNRQQKAPINPWAAMPVDQRSLDAPASRS